MSKILYILGTGYCGSTVLEICLGVHQDIVNVGEVNRVLHYTNKDEFDKLYFLDESKNSLCSCGKKMGDCDYWRGFYDILVKNLDKPFAKKYQLHYDYFCKRYPDKIMIDSSKSLSSLKEKITALKYLNNSNQFY